jgi:hypothetical protein
MSKFSRFFVYVALTIFAVALPGNVRAATDSTDAISISRLQQYICDSHPTSKALADDKKKHPELKDITCPDTTADATAKPAAAPNKPSDRAPVQVASQGDPKKNPPPDNGSPKTKGPFSLLLRNDWTDAGLLGASCLQPASNSSGGGDGGGSQSDSSGAGVDPSAAKGASVSFTRDYASNNKIWAAKGMVAGVYTECPPLALGEIIEKSLSVYAQINSDYNSNATVAKKNNIDTRTAGLAGELAYLTTKGDLNVVRVVPNVVFDNIKNTTTSAAMVQLVPMWVGSFPGMWAPIGIPFGSIQDFINFQFNPMIELQYASAMEHSQPLQFSGKDQSFRIGPNLTFILGPSKQQYVESNPLTHIGINETFHPWYEAYDAHGHYWWENSIFYNFNQDGSIALALSYSRGLDENSGTMTNQYTLSLTGKI